MPREAPTLRLANTESAISFGRRHALFVTRYFRYVADEQSGDLRGGGLRLVPYDNAAAIGAGSCFGDGERRVAYARPVGARSRRRAAISRSPAPADRRRWETLWTDE
jgi:hypothetical protein